MPLKKKWGSASSIFEPALLPYLKTEWQSEDHGGRKGTEEMVSKWLEDWGVWNLPEIAAAELEVEGCVWQNYIGLSFT